MNSGGIEVINSNLKESFGRIKRDMQSMRDWLVYFKGKEDDHENRLESIESRLDELGEVLAYMQQSQEQGSQESIVLNEEEDKKGGEKMLDDLTDTQRSIFYRLGTLLYESSQEWITAKALAQELYPEKSYDKVRSTMSEYLSILLESGLVKKKRRGKLTYVSITEKGGKFFEKIKRTKVKKVVVKKMPRPS